MIVVADTSPINYLVLIDKIDCLPSLFKQIIVPPAVVDELCDPRAPQAVKGWALSLPPLVAVQAPRRIQSIHGLHAGETELIKWDGSQIRMY